MQKLILSLLGIAVSVNMALPQRASSQSLSAMTPPTKSKTLKASILVDHKLSKVNGHEGALTVKAIGGKPPYTYKWSTGSVLDYVNGLGIGVYTVIVKDAAGASASSRQQIGQLDCETASCEFRTQTQGGWGAVPNGNNNGVYLHANFANAFPNGLVLGCTYTLTLTSAQAVTDFLPSGSTAAAMTASLVDPAGAYDNVLAGQVVTLALNVGFDNYDPDFGTSTAALADLVIASGDFAGLTVQQLLDEAINYLGGCASNYTASQLNDAVTAVNENFDNGNQNQGYLLCPDASTLEVSIDATGETCAELCNGTAEAIVTGGNMPYSYLWSNSATTASISGLCPANYDLTVTDALGCEAVANADVNPSQASLQAEIAKTDISCNGDNNGSVEVTVNIGQPPYSYVWSPAVSNSENASGLAAGVYQVHIEDANGCVTDLQEEIIDPAVLVVAGSAVDATCQTANGSVHALASGGTEPYSYLWSPTGATTADVDNVAAGVHAVVVTDANGCEANTDVLVQGGSINLQVINEQDASCPGMEDGSATVDPSGGTAPYTFLWSPVGGTDATATGLAAGLYDVYVEDYLGCSAVIQVEIGNQNPYCSGRFAASSKEVKGLSIYPSIISSDVKIFSNYTEPVAATVTITSLDGKSAISGNMVLQVNKETSVNTNDLAPGIYSMRVVVDTESYVVKIVKK